MSGTNRCIVFVISTAVSVYSLAQVPTEISGLNVAPTLTPTRIPNYQEVLYFLEHKRSRILKANMIIRIKANSGQSGFSLVF
jgi:hypothetical protein